MSSSSSSSVLKALAEDPDPTADKALLLSSASQWESMGLLLTEREFI